MLVELCCRESPGAVDGADPFSFPFPPPQVGDHKFSAHRIVLAASIPYFHAMFTNDMMECKQEEIVMQGMDPR